MQRKCLGSGSGYGVGLSEGSVAAVETEHVSCDMRAGGRARKEPGVVGLWKSR